MQSLDLLGQLARSEHDHRQRRAELRRLTAERRLALLTPHPVEPADLPAPAGAGPAPRWWPALRAGLCAEPPPVAQRVLLAGRTGASPAAPVRRTTADRACDGGAVAC